MSRLTSSTSLRLVEPGESLSYYNFILRLNQLGFQSITVSTSLIQRWIFIGIDGVLEFPWLGSDLPCDSLAVAKACKMIGLQSEYDFWTVSTLAYVPEVEITDSNADNFLIKDTLFISELTPKSLLDTVFPNWHDSVQEPSDFGIISEWLIATQKLLNIL